MQFPYYWRKAIEAAAVLLQAYPCQKMTRLRLLKLLYLADRQSLAETCRPITGDKVVAMDHGPVLSKTYECIRGRGRHRASWAKHFRAEGDRDIVLTEDPGVHALCRYEVRILKDIARQWKGQNDSALWKWVHGGNLPEYNKHEPSKGGKEDIPLEDIIEAVKRGGLLDKIRHDAQRQRTAEALLGGR